MNPGSDAGLREELERLKRISGMGTGLKLVWAPDPRGALSGEVKGDRYLEDLRGQVIIDLQPFIDEADTNQINRYFPMDRVPWPLCGLPEKPLPELCEKLKLPLGPYIGEILAIPERGGLIQCDPQGVWRFCP